MRVARQGDAVLLLPPLLDQDTFRRLSRDYTDRWPVALHCCDATGCHRAGSDAGDWDQEAAARACEQALRWGEPILTEAADAQLYWAVPILCNQAQLGALVAVVPEALVFSGDGDLRLDLRSACGDLQDLLIAADLTNGSLLAERRSAQERERQRAADIHAAKRGSHRDLVSAYLDREQALLAAVRRGRRAEARAIINEVLVAYFHAGNRELEVVKSLLLELVVMLCRGAVAGGVRQEEVFGLRFASLVDLVGIDDDEGLSAWLTDTLERLFDAVEAALRRSDAAFLQEVQELIGRECGDEDLDRDTVAAAVGLSPSGLGRLLKQEAGASFSEVLARTRIERARALLVQHDWSLLQVALEVGFKDPSYFTKVFKRVTGVTPKDYRRMLSTRDED